MNYARFTRPQAVPLDLRIDTWLALARDARREWTSLFTRKVRVVTVSPAR
ncbi:hypothetical protein HBB16_08440 [Pseudonocardia sp. MCCB 268]|nr:hypothetical protein [Pseudonocardia cytotoxica]